MPIVARSGSRPSSPSPRPADARWPDVKVSDHVYLGFCPHGCATAVTADEFEAIGWGIRYELVPADQARRLKLCTHDLHAQPQIELGAA